jgi:Talin, middle domain
LVGDCHHYASNGNSLNFVDQASVKWKQTQLDTNKQNVSSQIAAMNAATASVVTLTSGKKKK